MVQYFARLQSDLAAFLRSPRGLQQYVTTPVVLTGFSMGCGLSTLAALMTRQEAKDGVHKSTIQLINFGAPKLGNRAFADYLHQQLDIHDTYYVYGDPVASFPEDPDYALPGNIVVFSRNEERHLADQQWKFAGTPYTSNPPPHHQLVTPTQMKLGLQDAAYPALSSVGPLLNCHAMHSLKAVFDSLPVSTLALDMLRQNYGPDQHMSWVDSFLLPLVCPARSPYSAAFHE